MSHSVNARAAAPRNRPEGRGGPPLDAATEARVRQLIAEDDREAVRQARDLHRQHRTAASEALLIDAYVARIQSLQRRDLRVEAQALTELVRERHPSARSRLAELSGRAEARPATLDELVRPLADPLLGADRRAAIEHRVRCEVWDLAGLAGCEALPADHALRLAASALSRAFVAVTSGPVADAALALPEVAHRSPLAPWKRLIRAIASFHQGEDAACRQHLDGIDAESVAARAVPVLRRMLDGDAPARQADAAAALMSKVGGSPAAWRSVLRTLDEAFASEHENRIVKAIRAAVQECRRSAPDQLDMLVQRIGVRSAMLDLDAAKIIAAHGVPRPPESAATFRLIARGMEESKNLDLVVPACLMWEAFRKQAPREGWFAPNGPEAALVYLRMAELLDRLPADRLEELQRSVELPGRKRRQLLREGVDPADLWFVVPERLYQRAAALDPDSDSFVKWMEWTSRAAPHQTDRVAEAWRKARPRDLAPMLHLMNAAARRGAFDVALGQLYAAERIDSVHSEVRGAKLRLLAGSFMRHVQQQKIAAAERELAELVQLPQAHEGDRRALVAGLRWQLASVRGAQEEAAAARIEMEQALGGRAAATLLLSSLTPSTAPRKRKGGAKPEHVRELAPAERDALPVTVATVARLAADLHLTLNIPAAWMQETALQFQHSRTALDGKQLRALGDAALAAKHYELAFAVSAEGLARDGTASARFLLLRAKALSPTAHVMRGTPSGLTQRTIERRLVCAAAAAALARAQRDMALVNEAVEVGGTAAGLVLSADQAARVLHDERAHPAWPAGREPGPDYGDLLEPTRCQCPRCRRDRGESASPFDDLDDAFEEVDDPLDDFAVEDDEPFELPPGIPPGIAAAFMDEMQSAMRRGESVDQFLNRFLRGGKRRSKRRKGRRG